MIVEDDEHSNGAPTIEDTGVRVADVVTAVEDCGYTPRVVANRLYPMLSEQMVREIINSRD